MVIKPTKEMKELASKLGVKVGCSFRVKLINRKRKTLNALSLPLIYNDFSKMVFMISDELFIMGDYDGFSQWYGGQQLYAEFMSKGLLVVNKEQTKKTSLL